MSRGDLVILYISIGSVISLSAIGPLGFIKEGLAWIVNAANICEPFCSPLLATGGARE